MANRLLEVVELLGRFPAGLTVTEVAAELRVNKATSSRLLKSLAEAGTVAQDAGSRRFTSRIRMTPMITPAMEQLREVSLSPMAHAVRTCPEMGLHLGFNVGMESYFILGVTNSENLVIARMETHSTPANSSAVGKMLLALMPENELDGLLQQPLVAMSPGTIVDPQLLRSELQAFRKTRIAIQNRETGPMGYSFASPIYDQGGVPIAAIGAAIRYWSGDDAVSRAFYESSVPIVTDITVRISRFMGYRGIQQHVVA